MHLRLFTSLVLLAICSCRGPVGESESPSPCVPNLVHITSDSVADFFIQPTPVTVSMFEVFAKAGSSGEDPSAGHEFDSYTTQAEIFGNSGVFDYDTKEWGLVEGAYYRQPFGPDEGDAPNDHPATQISFYDARAYCTHYGMRLPTEAEWEAAARYKQPGGTTMYPWGNQIKTTEDGYRANVWQGLFPHVKKVEDGYAYTSPVDAYPAAPSGLYDMAGNVWEWVSDSIAGVGVPGDDTHRLGKGGSFLCEPNWCHGYLITGSTHNSSETGLFHTGFRCVCEEK
ncbi:MAG: formylglycine-generating enzyme family protein [Saprospiraceae bacterium]